MFAAQLLMIADQLAVSRFQVIATIAFGRQRRRALRQRGLGAFQILQNDVHMAENRRQILPQRRRFLHLADNFFAAVA